MISPPAQPGAAIQRDPVVVLAADDRFAMGLAATVRSAIDNLSPDSRLRLYILDGGIQPDNKRRLVQSWPAGRFDIEWLRVDASALADVPVSGHVNQISYYRILMPRLLPSDVERLIYLDADLIIRADLARLWRHDLSGHLCLAAQDCAAPYMDSSQVLASYQQCRAYLGSPWPVPNFRELGLRPDAAYFNAGVLLVDLAAWRDADLARQMLACLEQNQPHVRWWDQYALNVVLAGRWGSLDLRWNQGAQIFQYPTWEQSPFDRRTFEELRDDPYIVHFTTRHKPWLASCRHPLRKEFFQYVDRTAWAGWRPPRLKVLFERVRAQERTLRRGRKWLQNRLGQWFTRRGHSAAG
jgi:lipopolysaccharide biosynthesis glycosyltransferase